MWKMNVVWFILLLDSKSNGFSFQHLDSNWIFIFGFSILVIIIRWNIKLQNVKLEYDWNKDAKKSKVAVESKGFISKI